MTGRIDWSSPIAFRDGWGVATLLPADGWQQRTGDTRRRVARQEGKQDKEPVTVILCDDRGRCNPDRESPWDVVAAKTNAGDQP
jgi:hypothetical protein